MITLVNQTSVNSVSALIDIMDLLSNSGAVDDKEVFQKNAARILSCIICYQKMVASQYATISSKWLRGTKLLLQEISSVLPKRILTRYLVAILQVVNSTTAFEPGYQAIDDLTECVSDAIMNMF